MGGQSSKSSTADRQSLYANGRADFYGSVVGEYQQRELTTSTLMRSNLTPLPPRHSMDKKLQERKEIEGPTLAHKLGVTGYTSNEDDFYDGIPRLPKAVSEKTGLMGSKQMASGKVSDVSSRLGRAGTSRLGKAVEVLDTLGSSVTNLNRSSGFVSGVTIKGNELSILSFEVANTIVKGSSLVQSLSSRSIRLLKEVVLSSEGVQQLVSKDMDELLKIVAADKRGELKIFSGEVIRFGNRCKDSQWHNLDRYFEKRSRENIPHKQLKEGAESVIRQLMTLVHYTAELYQELHILDRLEQDYHCKCLEENNSNVIQRVDSLRAALKVRKKQVKNLKKKSLWSMSMEEVMEKLVDVVLFLKWEIPNAFGSADNGIPSKGSMNSQLRLGPAGLALHYANIVLQIDSIVARFSSMPPSARETLYRSLPSNIKSSLRSKLLSFHVKEELTLTEIKDEMEKTLHWLVPIAANTAKALHGFGWVGEWGDSGSDVNRKSAGVLDVIQIETFHYADKEKTEASILELLLWLHHLISCSKTGLNGGGIRPAIKSSASPTLLETNQHHTSESTGPPSPMLHVEGSAVPAECLQ